MKELWGDMQASYQFKTSELKMMNLFILKALKAVQKVVKT